MRSVIQHPALAGARISILAKTIDQYRTATVYMRNGHQLRFLDSFQFVASSLDEIGISLAPEDLNIWKAVYSDKQHQTLLRRKGVFCYEFVQSYTQMLEQTVLPAREHFFSSLYSSLPSEEDYARAGEVWRGLGCKNLLDYCVHYLQPMS